MDPLMAAVRGRRWSAYGSGLLRTMFRFRRWTPHGSGPPNNEVWFQLMAMARAIQLLRSSCEKSIYLLFDNVRQHHNLRRSPPVGLCERRNTNTPTPSCMPPQPTIDNPFIHSSRQSSSLRIDQLCTFQSQRSLPHLLRHPIPSSWRREKHPANLPKVPLNHKSKADEDEPFSTNAILTPTVQCPRILVNMEMEYAILGARAILANMHI